VYSNGPGSIAAQGLMNLYALLHAHANEEILAAADGIRNLLEVTFTLAAIGTALAIPRLIYPKKTPHASWLFMDLAVKEILRVQFHMSPTIILVSTIYLKEQQRLQAPIKHLLTF
jgi:hypothetical protein